MDLTQGGKSPVNIVLKFKNTDLIGLSKAKVYNVSGFNKNPQGDSIEIRLKAPVIQLYGSYKINGRVLILPIQGDGMLNFTLENFKLDLKYLTKAVERDGKTFSQISRTRSTIDTTRFEFSLYFVFFFTFIINF